MSARKFAIAGTMPSGSTIYWTGGIRKPWTFMETKAKTWASDTFAATWLPRVPAAEGMTNLRVLEVAP